MRCVTVAASVVLLGAREHSIAIRFNTRNSNIHYSTSLHMQRLHTLPALTYAGAFAPSDYMKTSVVDAL